MDELRLVFRLLVLLGLGYVGLAHFAVANIELWCGWDLPDPVTWLWRALPGLY
jgi:hypothetical protein